MQMICGRYRIDELAGRGGFGSVYRGYDESMDRPVAVKVVETIGDREAAILKSLDHKGLPRLYDIYRDRDHTYMIMEWIEGTDLERLIEMRGALSEKKTVRYGTEILKILDYLHRLHPAVIYQDLKPANIMITPDGHVKLVDFGTALVLSYGDDAERLAGTVGYGSPEQRGLCGTRHASVRSDIYAWGAVMYSCISGRMLNKPPYTMDRLRYVAPSVSYGLAHVISRACAREERSRYGSVREVMRALESSIYTDLICRGSFMLLMAVCALPFVYAWFMSSGDGLFAGIQAMMLHQGSDMSIWKHAAYVRDVGALMATGGCMIIAYRLIQVRRFMRIHRSVYLSSRRYPGLWIGALIAGIVLGAGVGAGPGTGISHAEEISDHMSGAASADLIAGGAAADRDHILPVSLMDEGGGHLLVRYDAPYTPDGDVRLVIDRDVLGRFGDGRLSVSYITDSEGEAYERSINLQIDPDMWYN